MKIILITLLALAVSNLAPAQELTEWKDPKIPSVGKEHPRAEFISYTNREKALTWDKNNSENYISLNGVWKFLYTNNHNELPVSSVINPDINFSNWYDINVPGNMELQGYGDPIYTNIPYEFAPANPKPPTLPDNVPVGVYKRNFEVPLAWLDKDIYLNMAGAKSGVYIFVNGQKVGYNEDSKNPGEFLLNPYVKEGINNITILVYRWSVGSWLECQDFWRLSGMEREVYIHLQPKYHIHDFHLEATMDSTYTHGNLKLDVVYSNSYNSDEPVQLYYEILNDKGEIIKYYTKDVVLPAASKDTLEFEAVIPRPKMWSAENPNLYTIVLRTKIDKRFVEYIPFKFGFRSIKIDGNQLLVNGKPVLIKGVNYHEHSSTDGHYVDEALLRKDLELMKSNNINAIRCSHYPQQRRFYELCDEYGFYVCDEANIESHGMGYSLAKGHTLGNNPLWHNAHMERTRNMYYRNRNYTSIIFWSLGNEAGNGINFYETYDFLKSVDSLRPVQYERALLEWNTDIFCPQYPSAAALKRWGESKTDRPYIPSEYAHAMGNSTGNLKDQWDQIYKYDNLQGGFIWDWADQSIADSTRSTSAGTFMAYGGDYGKNQPSDGNFCCNGLVGGDRVPHPGLKHVKHIYQNIRITDLGSGEFNIKNGYFFTSLSDYNISYKVYANNRVVRTVPLKLSLAPGESKNIKVSLSGLAPSRGVEYFVNFSATAKDGSRPGIEAGELVASDQFKLPIETPERKVSSTTAVGLKDDGSKITASASGSGLRFVVDKQSGVVTSYSLSGRGEMILDGEGLRPNFWRAPTDNDYGYGMASKAYPWRDASMSHKASSVTSSKGKGCAIISVSYDLVHNAKCYVDYTVYPSGAVHVAMRYKGGNGTGFIPRIGMRMTMDGKYTNLRYFGRGPEENYIDRNSDNFVGEYSTSVRAMYVPYVRPQENGHRSGVRWVSVGENRSGKNALMVKGDEPIEFNAHRNRNEEFDGELARTEYQWRNVGGVQNDADARNSMKKQTHACDLIEKDLTELSIDYRMEGVGGDDSWGARPYQEYRLPESSDYSYGFTLIPVTSFEASWEKVGYDYSR